MMAPYAHRTLNFLVPFSCPGSLGCGVILLGHRKPVPNHLLLEDSAPLPPPPRSPPGLLNQNLSSFPRTERGISTSVSRPLVLFYLVIGTCASLDVRHIQLPAQCLGHHEFLGHFSSTRMSSQA